MKFILKLLSIITFCLFSTASLAIERPEVELKKVTDQMLSALKDEAGSIEKNPARLNSIINNILVPHVDIDDMSRWVIGRNAWMKATPAQRAQFSQAFKKLLIRTYSSNLTAYTNQTIEYLPVRDNIQTANRVQVATLIKSADRAPIRVSYRLKKVGNQWLLYDISVEGVSLLRGFKAQFEPQVQSSGMDGLIEKIQAHNQKPML